MSYPDALDDLIDDIQDWQLKTFPQSTLESKFAHLEREIVELGKDLTSESEIADCLFLLIGLARTQGYDIQRILSDKFKINKSRQWGVPDESGVVEHVRTIDEAEAEGKLKALAIGVSFDLSKRCVSVAIVSGDLGSCELIHVKKFTGTMNDQLYAARRVIDKYPTARVLADSTGNIGAVGVRALRDLGSHPPIEDYIFNRDEQRLIEMNLGLMVKRKALSAPMEMLRDISGDLDMSALDDVIFALALAVWRLPAPCPPSSTP